MAKRDYPCDTKNSEGKFVCPFATEGESTGMYFCRDMCGLGVDDDSADDEIYEPDVDESMNPYDGTYE